MTDKPRTKHRTRWIVGSILIVLTLLIAGTGYMLRSNAKRFIVERIGEAVRKHMGAAYKFEISDLSIDLIGGEITVRGVSLRPDSTVVDSLARAGRAPHALYSIATDAVHIFVSHPRRDIRRNNLEIRRLVIERPRVEILRDSVPLPPRKEGKFRLPFSTVTVHEIEIRGGTFAYDRSRALDTVSHRVEGIDLHIEKLVLDSTFNVREVKLPPLDQFRCRVAGTSHSPAGEAYTLKVGHAELDLQRRSLLIDSLELVPHYGKVEFVALTRSKTDWMRLRVEQLLLSGVDFEQLMRREGFTADSIAIVGPHIESYKNRQVHVPARVKPLFHDLLKRAPISIRVRTITVRDGQAVYEELPVKGGVAGRIHLDDIQAHIDSLTNVEAGGQDYFTMHATAHMMGRGVLSADFLFPVGQQNEHFAVRGTLGRMHLEAFNPMLEPLAHLSVREGRIRRIDFNMEGDSTAGVIEMRLQYDSLRVDVLNKIGMRSWAGSTLVNDFIVEQANPMPGQEVRTVHASAVRDPYRSNFNYLWRMAFEGTKESVGLTKQKQERFAGLKEKLQQMKAARELRREQRAEKRER